MNQDLTYRFWKERTILRLRAETPGTWIFEENSVMLRMARDRAEFDAP